MKFLLILILIFIIYNIKDYDFFSNTAILSPDIQSIEKKNNTLDITFTKDTNDNLNPGDDFVYELYLKEDNKLLEVEKTYTNNKYEVNPLSVNLDTWDKKNIRCDELECNHIENIIPSKTYYLFILTKTENRRSNIKTIYKISGNDKDVFSPDILQIVKNGSRAQIVFQRSRRDTSLPDSIFRYEIYFKEDSLVQDELSPSPSPSPTDDLMRWNKKVVLCDKLMCQNTITNLEENEKYHFFIVQIKNGKKSSINNIVLVENNKPYKPIEFSLERNQAFFSIGEESVCENYGYDNCPDEITGTILSRCYKDKESEKCKKTVEEEYLE